MTCDACVLTSSPLLWTTGDTGTVLHRTATSKKNDEPRHCGFRPCVTVVDHCGGNETMIGRTAETLAPECFVCVHKASLIALQAESSQRSRQTDRLEEESLQLKIVVDDLEERSQGLEDRNQDLEEKNRDLEEKNRVLEEKNRALKSGRRKKRSRTCAGKVGGVSQNGHSCG